MMMQALPTDYVLHVECPYCGTLHPQVSKTTMPEVVYCDVECGGCDQPFVLEMHLKPTHTARRIEGVARLEVE